MAARVLEQVVRQLLLQAVLVGLELRPVLGRQVDPELVRHVGTRERDALRVLHLLRQLAGELDRLDLRAERAAEGPLHEAFQLRLEVSEHAHRTAILRKRLLLDGPRGEAHGGRRDGHDHGQDRAAHGARAPGRARPTKPPDPPPPRAPPRAPRPTPPRRARPARASGRARRRGARPRTRPRSRSGPSRATRAAGTARRSPRRWNESSQSARGAVPSAVPNSSASPVSTSASSSHQKPAAARPARRHAVEQSPARATNSGASATTPRSGASAGADHRTPARGSRNGTGARPAARTSAVPSRSAPGEASQPTRHAAAASQPIRGQERRHDRRGRCRGEARDRRLGAERLERGEHQRRPPPRPRRAVPGTVLRGLRDALDERPVARARQAEALERRGLDQAALVREVRLGVRERAAQLGDRRAAARVRVEAGVDHVAELVRQVAAAICQPRQAAAEAARGAGRAVAAHRVHARPRLVQHQRERVDVGGRGDAQALGLLGGHVGERARPRRPCA